MAIKTTSEWPTHAADFIGHHLVGSTLLEQTNSNYQFGDSITANGQPLLIKTTSAYADANNSLVTVAKTYRTDAPDISLSSLPYSVQKPDGTQGDGLRLRARHLRCRLADFHRHGRRHKSRSAHDHTQWLGFRRLTVGGLGSGADRSHRPRCQPFHRDGGHLSTGFLVRRESWVCTSSASFEQQKQDNFTYTADGRLVSCLQQWHQHHRHLGWRPQDEARPMKLGSPPLTSDSMSRVTSVTRQAVGSLPALCTQYTYDADSGCSRPRSAGS